MDIDDVTNKTETLRIEDCEVCGKNKAKYTCPRCEVRTCCLDCVKIHKKELECNGIRDKVKFKTLKNFSNIDLLNDYRFLEETARLVSKSVKLPHKSCYHPTNGTLPLDLYRLKSVASYRGVKLHFLPPSFSRHCLNTSYLDHGTQSLYWKIDWVFPQAENIVYTDEKVLDSSLLSACVHKYIVPDDRTYSPLSFYQAAGHAGVTLLLKAERTSSNRFYMMEPTTTVRENLSGKVIIENPVIYVVLNYHISLYNVLTEEEESDLRRKHRRRLHNKSKTSATVPSNYLFSNTNVEEFSDTDDTTNAQGGKVNRLPFKKNFKFSHRGRGRGHFKGRWNNKYRRRGQHWGHSIENNREFSNNAVNEGLSNSFGAINMQSQ